MKLFKNNSGFSLLEFVTVLVIIMILTSLALVSLNIFRQKNRDIKRVTDVQDLQGSLEMYYRDYQIYPTMITFGSAFAAGSKIYIENLPTNPAPRNDGSCPNLEYDYSPDNDNTSYHLAFCLSTDVADLNSGINVASPEGELDAGAAADYDTKLLLHLNNNVTDISPNTRTITNNNVTFSSATAKFGGYSGAFNGTTAYLSVPDSEDWFFGADEFTIDFWFYSSDFTGNNSVVAQYQDISNYWNLYADATNGWTLIVKNELTTDISFNQGVLTANTGTWYHIALVRNGDNFKIYQGGTSVASVTDIDTFYNKAAVLVIGQSGNSQWMDGYLDEVRISKGVARWTGNFTAPTAEY